MKKGFSIKAAWLLVAVAVLAAEVHGACTPSELSVCLPAITEGQSPTPACCARLKDQAPCFCGYKSNPMFKPYIDSPTAKGVLAKCGVPMPTC